MSQNAGLTTSARSAAAAGSEVSKILEERILGQESNINLEETGKVRYPYAFYLLYCFGLFNKVILLLFNS